MTITLDDKTKVKPKRRAQKRGRNKTAEKTKRVGPVGPGKYRMFTELQILEMRSTIGV